MRDIVLAGLIVWGCIGSLMHPWIGILVWNWISLMSPHKLTYLMMDKPVAMMSAVTIFLGLLITADRKRFYLTRESGALLMFMFWIICVTFPMAQDLDGSMVMWNKVWRVDLMILIAIAVIHTRAQLVAFVWVVAFSLGFFGFKGGLFTIAHGGSYRVWGPDGSWVEGNNELALALIVVIPLIRFLQTQVPSKRGKQFLGLWMILVAFSAVGSHSRGALLAIVSMAVVMILRAEKNRAGLAAGMVAMGIVIALFMPKEWTQRMETTQTYQQDSSAMGRINTWWMTFRLANSSPIFGGGFEIYTPKNFVRFAPDPLDVHVAHSIYFSVLGEHGYVGLFLFLWMWLQVWLGAGKLRQAGHRDPEYEWVGTLGSMVQVSLVGYLVGGAFLSLAYFDLPYNLLAFIVIARRWVEKREPVEELQASGRMGKLLTALGIVK